MPVPEPGRPAGPLRVAPPAAWRRFLAVLVLTAAGLGGALYLFVVLVDPWGSLPLSLPLPRVPISTNARYSFPALARSAAFDSAVLGTSTSRLLRPAMLDAALGGRFANLAMNSATAWEQARLLTVFARAHPQARSVVVGLDDSWCRVGTGVQRNARPFPDWMYARHRWAGYGAMFTLYALQEAVNQAGVLLHLKRVRYGRDGYTDFLPPDSRYDPVRVDAIFRAWGTPSAAPPTGAIAQPELAGLAPMLRLLPNATLKLLFFTPDSVEQQGVPGSAQAAKWAACKAQVARDVAGVPGVVLVDFLRPSPITTRRDNYWDPIHYRVEVAARLVADLAAAVRGEKGGQDWLGGADFPGIPPTAVGTMPGVSVGG